MSIPWLDLRWERPAASENAACAETKQGEIWSGLDI